MAFAKLLSLADFGNKIYLVNVEIHVSLGLPNFTIVGLPDVEVRESRERVRSAIQNSGFEFPARRIIVNLAPADLPKHSGRYDLSIALGILIATQNINCNIDYSNHAFLGELALNGQLRYTNGLSSTIFSLTNNNLTTILPKDNLSELNFIKNMSLLGGLHLKDIISYLSKNTQLTKPQDLEPTISNCSNDHNKTIEDFANIKGHILPKKALEIAAAGKHSILMWGPPGCGKSMLANSILSILPLLNYQESLQVAAIYSNSSIGFYRKNWGKIPFRNPHHTTSAIAMIGGGAKLKAGEVSLAHNGILFLDELPEFAKNVIEVLREPFTNKYITLSRANYKIKFNTNFQLIAAMNPCPCGNYGSNIHNCYCTKSQIIRYNCRISQPIWDRIDMIVPVQMIKHDELFEQSSYESSATIANRVLQARNTQIARQGKLNYLLSNSEIDDYIAQNCEFKKIAEKIMKTMNLSMRGYYNMIKIAITIHDLDNQQIKLNLTKHHIALASVYKNNITNSLNYE